MIHQGLSVEPPVLLPVVPPLEPGDHLTRAEFERRYDATPGLKKAELIEGVVHMPPSVRFEQHAQPHALILLWLGIYSAYTPFTKVGDNGSVRLDGDNMPQPDAAMIIASNKGGQARLSEDDYVEGAPELIVEVAASTASLDLNTKFRVYRRNNVREYIVWRIIENSVDWFALEDGEYRRLVADADGFIRSRIFPGLWLDPKALSSLDSIRVLQVVGLGMADPSHAAFVAKLQA